MCVLRVIYVKLTLFCECICKKASKIYVPIISSSLISIKKSKVQRWKVAHPMTMLILILVDSMLFPYSSIPVVIIIEIKNKIIQKKNN